MISSNHPELRSRDFGKTASLYSGSFEPFRLRVSLTDGTVARLPAQSLLVVDEAEVSRLTDKTSGTTRVHTGLALLRHQQPEGAERRPDWGC